MAKVTYNKDGTPRKQGRGRKKGSGRIATVKLRDLITVGIGKEENGIIGRKEKENVIKKIF